MASPGADGAVDLAALEIAPGEVRVVDVPLPAESVTIGGNEYALTAEGEAVPIEVTHTHSGWHIRVRAAGALSGPCWRCLADARVPLSADLSDFSSFGRDASDDFDDDLDSEYVERGIMDAPSIARDALLEGLPTVILCSDTCRGLCPVCGANRNATSCECAIDTRDARWDALQQVADRLKGTSE